MNLINRPYSCYIYIPDKQDIQERLIYGINKHISTRLGRCQRAIRVSVGARILYGRKVDSWQIKMSIEIEYA